MVCGHGQGQRPYYGRHEGGLHHQRCRGNQFIISEHGLDFAHVPRCDRGRQPRQYFDWKAAGESTYDYMLVQVAPTFTPMTGTIPAGVTVLGQINLQTAFGRTTL